MIRIHIDNGNLKGESVEFGGSISDLAADIMFQIALVYGTVKMKDKNAASEFKRDILCLLSDDEARNMVFSEEVAKSLSDGGVLKCVTNKDDEDENKESPKKKKSGIDDEEKEKLVEMFREILDL